MGGLRSGIYPVYFSDEEPIASLWNGLDVAGIFGVIVQRLPELAHRYPETAVKIYECISRPETASKFAAGDHFPGVFEECDEEPTGLLLQSYASPVFEEFPGGGVYLKRAELVDNSGICLHTFAPKVIETDEESSLPLRAMTVHRLPLLASEA
jgi:hypothetical protein